MELMTRMFRAGCAVAVVFMAVSMIMPGGWHWWSDLGKGDWGTWISGLGSLLAAAVALWIALRNESSQRQGALAEFHLFLQLAADQAALADRTLSATSDRDRRLVRVEISVLNDYARTIQVAQLSSKDAYAALRTRQFIARIDAILEQAIETAQRDSVGMTLAASLVVAIALDAGVVTRDPNGNSPLCTRRR